jgi:hypothetical protein
MSALSDRAAALFEYLPSTYGTDPDDVDPVVARWLEALAFEIDRVRALYLALRATTIPASATDEVGALSRWEHLMRLPVAPAGDSDAQRRARLLGALQGRRVAHGSDWTASMEAVIGSADWEPFEHTPGPNQLTIRIPYEAGTAKAGQIAEHARRITPANQQLIFQHEGGFVVGVSQVGDTL